MQQTAGAVRRRPWQCAVLGLGIVMGLVGLLASGSCANQEAGTTPGDVQKGEGLFKANCLRCHGDRGAGALGGEVLVAVAFQAEFVDLGGARRRTGQGQPGGEQEDAPEPGDYGSRGGPPSSSSGSG